MAGVTPAQHQLLLAVRGHQLWPRGPTIGEVIVWAYRLICCCVRTALVS